MVVDHASIMPMIDLLPTAYRDAGSGIAQKNLKRVKKAWGQGRISSL